MSGHNKEESELIDRALCVGDTTTGIGEMLFSKWALDR